MGSRVKGEGEGEGEGEGDGDGEGFDVELRRLCSPVLPSPVASSKPPTLQQALESSALGANRRLGR